MNTCHHTGALAETKHFPKINHLTMALFLQSVTFTSVIKCETLSIKEVFFAHNE
jgi:hypothetical protein